MSEESVALGPIRPVPQAGAPKYREREDQARMAFIDAVAARVARELADAPLPAPSAT